MSKPRGPSDYDVGYGKPPKATRFRKGRSANPRGRPRGRKWQPPFEAILGQMVTVRENGEERLMRADEAFLEHMIRKGLQRHSPSTRDLLLAITEARAKRLAVQRPFRMFVEVFFVAVGSVSIAIEPLRMGRILNRYDEVDRHILLEPWLVESALARLGDRRFTLEEQRTIVETTRTPEKVRWPPWWKVTK